MFTMRYRMDEHSEHTGGEGATEPEHKEPEQEHAPEPEPEPEHTHEHCPACHASVSAINELSEKVDKLVSEGTPEPEDETPGEPPHDDGEVRDKSPHGVPWTHKSLF